MSQWGSKDLGEQGYSPIEILRYYYGDDIYINSAEQISGSQDEKASGPFLICISPGGGTLQ